MESFQTSRQAITTSTSFHPEPGRRAPDPSARRPFKKRSFRPRELREAGLAPLKARGQHFLTDRRILTRIADACALGPSDCVIEIGPGLGALTERLIEAAGQVTAIEIDGGLCSHLREKFAARANLTIIEQDALLVDPARVFDPGEPKPYVLVGNLPYNSGLAIVRHVLESGFPPSRAVVMLQKEVADGIVAGPGSMTLAGIGVQVFAEARRLFDVAPAAFYPAPKVRSTVIRLDVREAPVVAAGEQARFFTTVRAGFNAPRKQVRNSLAQGLGLEPTLVERMLTAAAVDPTQRPADLTIDDWSRLSREEGR